MDVFSQSRRIGLLLFVFSTLACFSRFPGQSVAQERSANSADSTHSANSTDSAAIQPKHLAFRAVPFTEVKFEDAFWSPRLKTNRDISIPHNYQWCENTGRFTNFAKAARVMDGRFEGIFFNDSDVYKLLEGSAYSLADHPDAELEKRADRVIDWIAAAQLPNGYINSYYQLEEPEKTWTDIGRHELYCCGHLIEAAVAYKRATGKDKLLGVAERFVDHVIDVFGPEKKTKFEVPGHEEIELALVKLYEWTGKEKYLKLSEQFVDVRGDQSKRGDRIRGAYEQDHAPIRQQSEIVGHAVRAVYLYAGVADIAAYTGDEGYVAAMDRLWNDVVNKKMYVTGGIGARHEGEAFGNAFELPNRSAYCETCAAIGLVFWAHRMNLLHGDAKYADVVERCMYNGVLSGIGLDGKSFFYVNPLSSRGNHHRQPFYDCACCPTNVVRFVPSLPGYQYVVQGNTVYVNQYVAGTAKLSLQDGELTITQKTNYPWDGKVDCFITNKPKKGAKSKFKVVLREPAWAHDQGEGTYAGSAETSWNQTESNPATQTTVHLGKDFKMLPKRIVAHPRVEADRGRVAIRRGPLVYCFEQVDNVVPTDRIVLAKHPEFTEEFREDLLGGILVLKCRNVDGRELTAIPYYAWDHRAAGKMDVWVRQEGLSRRPNPDDPAWTNPATQEPILYRELTEDMLGAGENDPSMSEEEKNATIMERAFADASHCHDGDSFDAILGDETPKNSGDHSLSRHTFWPHKGTKEWVEYSFDAPETLSGCSVYWFDDEGRGECRVPESWSISVLRDGRWVPVETGSDYAVVRDAPNVVKFRPVKTTAIRIDVQLKENFSGGVLRWKLNPVGPD